MSQNVIRMIVRDSFTEFFPQFPAENNQEKQSENQFSISTNSFSIYPNPTSGVVTIETSEQPDSDLQVRLTTVHGVVLSQWNWPQETGQIDINVETFPDGLYFFFISDEQSNQHFQRIVIAK
jgi:hypothetical protein